MKLISFFKLFNAENSEQSTAEIDALLGHVVGTRAWFSSPQSRFSAPCCDAHSQRAGLFQSMTDRCPASIFGIFPFLKLTICFEHL